MQAHCKQSPTARHYAQRRRVPPRTYEAENLGYHGALFRADCDYMMQRIGRYLLATTVVASALAAHLYMPAAISNLAAEAIRSLHAPGFGILAVILLRLGIFRGSDVRRYAKAATLAFLLAFAAESIQIPFGREAELKDLAADAIGILGFLGVSALLDGTIRQHTSLPLFSLFAISAIVAVLLALAPTTWLSTALVYRDMSMPVLHSFDSRLERAYRRSGNPVIPFEAPASWPADGRHAARLTSTGKSGLMLNIFPYPDWSGYEAVSFIAATVDGKPRRVALGFWGMATENGSPPGRYYTHVMIDQEPERYCVPLANLDRDRQSGFRHDLALGEQRSRPRSV